MAQYIESIEQDDYRTGYYRSTTINIGNMLSRIRIMWGAALKEDSLPTKIKPVKYESEVCDTKGSVP